jgi:hypothetical protein
MHHQIEHCMRAYSKFMRTQNSKGSKGFLSQTFMYANGMQMERGGLAFIRLYKIQFVCLRKIIDEFINLNMYTIFLYFSSLHD